MYIPPPEVALVMGFCNSPDMAGELSMIGFGVHRISNIPDFGAIGVS